VTCPDWIIYALIGAGVVGSGIGVLGKSFLDGFKKKDNPGHATTASPHLKCIYHEALVSDIGHTREDVQRVEGKLDKLDQKIDEMNTNCSVRTSGIMRAINGEDE
jgi:hypothetical protein